MLRFEKWSRGLRFENFDGIMSFSDFKFVAQPLLESYRSQIFLLSIVLDKNHMNVGKVVDKMTWESCIPTDSVKSGDDYSSLVHNIGIEAYV